MSSPGTVAPALHSSMPLGSLQPTCRAPHSPPHKEQLKLGLRALTSQRLPRECTLPE